MAATRVLLQSTWRHSPWGWMLVGVGMGAAVLGAGVLLHASGLRTPTASLMTVLWAMWLAWLLVLVMMLGRAGLLHYGLAQQLRLPGAAAMAIRLTSAAMLLVCALAAMGMTMAVQTVAPASPVSAMPPDQLPLSEPRWAVPWAWALAVLTLWMCAAGNLHPRGGQIFLGGVSLLALLLLAPTLALKRDEQLRGLALAAEHAQTLSWAGWSVTAISLSAFILMTHRLCKNGLPGWEAQVAAVRLLQPPHATRALTLAMSGPPTAPRTDRANLDLFVRPGSQWPTRSEWVLVGATMVAFAAYLKWVYKLDAAPLLAFALQLLMGAPGPSLQAEALSPRALLMPRGLHRQGLMRQLLSTSLRLSVPRLLIMLALGGAALWLATPVNAVQWLAIMLAAAGGHALNLGLPLCMLAWRWPPWPSLCAILIAAGLPMLTVLLWKGAAIWRPLESPGQWLAWGAVTLAAGLLLLAGALAAVRPALQRLDFGLMGRSSGPA